MDSPDLNRFLGETKLLDFNSANIQALIIERDWLNQDEGDRLAAIYAFVKEEIKFGYNAEEEIAASRVFEEGYGQCNTKSILLMALLRGVGLACRFHAFKVDTRLQKGVLPWIVYIAAPSEISHSWVEAWHTDRWIVLEGVILDKDYLDGVKARFAASTGSFCGYAVGTSDLEHTKEQWCGRDTYIQSTSITQDLGHFTSPDEYFFNHPSNIIGLRGVLWRSYFYKSTNNIVDRIRRGI